MVIPVVEIDIPPAWSRKIGSDVRVARWASDEVLVLYMGKVVERLTLMKQRYLQRKELAEALAAQLGVPPLQLNDEDYSSVSFLIDQHGFVLKLDIPPRYPRVDPEVRWESVSMHGPDGAPMSCKLPMGKTAKEPTPAQHAAYLVESVNNPNLIKKFKSVIGQS